MQITMPELPGYAGMFLVGQRERDGALERTGTVVLKRAYVIDSVAGTLTPAASTSLLMRDHPDNLVLNADFELSQLDLNEEPKDANLPGAWKSEAGTVAFNAAAGESSARGLRIDGTPGRVAQTIDFEQPLGGRTFTLSLYARTDSAVPLAMPVLAELALAPPDTGSIAIVSATLDGTMRRFEGTGTWPATVSATKARVLLHGAAAAADAVSVDRVQLEERATSTRWDPQTVLRYESDLAPYKPDADLVVLGRTGAGGVASTRVEGTIWLQRTIPAGEPEKAAFGWESRADPGPRKAALGTVASPPLPTLAPDFDNAFFNAFRRDSAATATFVVPAPDAEIDLRRVGMPDYRFQLRGDVAGAVLATYAGGADEPARWQRTVVPMTLDTIVVEPELDRCALVWRGAWPFDDAPVEAYRALTVNASA